MLGLIFLFFFFFFFFFFFSFFPCISAFLLWTNRGIPPSSPRRGRAHRAKKSTYLLPRYLHTYQTPCSTYSNSVTHIKLHIYICSSWIVLLRQEACSPQPRLLLSSYLHPVCTYLLYLHLYTRVPTLAVLARVNQVYDELAVGTWIGKPGHKDTRMNSTKCKAIFARDIMQCVNAGTARTVTRAESSDTCIYSIVSCS